MKHTAKKSNIVENLALILKQTALQNQKILWQHDLLVATDIILPG